MASPQKHWLINKAQVSEENEKRKLAPATTSLYIGTISTCTLCFNRGKETYNVHINCCMNIFWHTFYAHVDIFTL